MVYSAALLLILGMACCCSALRTQAADLPSLFSDVTSASRYVYDLKDDQGSQMACIHVYEAQDRNAWGGAPYFSVYHAMVGTEFEVRLATSHNLTSWQFRRTLLQNADMPYITRPSGVQTTWLLLTHEQWMNKGSQLPSRLGFKLYYNESSLAEGSHFVRLPTTGMCRTAAWLPKRVHSLASPLPSPLPGNLSTELLHRPDHGGRPLAARGHPVLLRRTGGDAGRVRYPRCGRWVPL